MIDSHAYGAIIFIILLLYLSFSRWERGVSNLRFDNLS